jgi:hypothetical protein
MSVVEEVESPKLRHPKAMTTTERTQKHRKERKPANDCFNVIALMTGEDTGCGGYRKHPVRLVCVDIYRKESWFGFALLGTGNKLDVKALEAQKHDYASTSRGYVGVSPPVLVANILRELKGGYIRDMDKELHWKNISIRTHLGEKSAGKGQYYMFHWGNKKNGEENNVPDWKANDSIFTDFVKNRVDDFAFNVTRRFLADAGVVDTKVKFLERFSVLPGMARTMNAYNQAAHTDFDSWGLIIHMPLSREGMMLMIWNETRESGGRVGKGEYHYVPFGCFFVLPSYVTHSGVYGGKGNYRFHMIIRRRSDNWERDEIKSGVITDNPNTRGPWRATFNKMKKEAGVFSDYYVAYLKEKLGSTFQEEWVK